MVRDNSFSIVKCHAKIPSNATAKMENVADEYFIRRKTDYENGIPKKNSRQIA